MTTSTTHQTLHARTPAVTLRDVLCLTDLFPLSESALTHARFLAEWFQAELTVYHAVESFADRYPYLTFGQEHAEVAEAAERLACSLLARDVRHVATRCAVKVERVRSAREAVVEMVRGRRPDLTVMATHGRGGLGHLFLGSVTEEVLHRAHTPVLCLRGGEASPYRRILVPTDLSVASRLAFPMAAFLARAFAAEVIGVHVVPPPTVATLSGIPGPSAPAPTEAALWEFFRTDFADVDVNAQVYSGSAWERIVHTAGVERADLIVMSTHGHDSLSDRIVGSNTERVLRHAACPVLVA
jgi:nucleotide-binding universal stress UspA family protein